MLLWSVYVSVCVHNVPYCRNIYFYVVTSPHRLDTTLAVFIRFSGATHDGVNGVFVKDDVPKGGETYIKRDTGGIVMKLEQKSGEDGTRWVLSDSNGVVLATSSQASHCLEVYDDALLPWFEANDASKMEESAASAELIFEESFEFSIADATGNQYINGDYIKTYFASEEQGWRNSQHTDVFLMWSKLDKDRAYQKRYVVTRDGGTEAYTEPPCDDSSSREYYTYEWMIWCTSTQTYNQQPDVEVHDPTSGM